MGTKLPRFLIGVAIFLLIVLSAVSVLRFGNARDAGLPADFATSEETGLIDRGPATSKVALVIGIDHYRNLGPDNQLERAKSDARAVAARLRALGYDTILDTDATREKIYLDLDRAVRKIKPGGAAFFYFAGHGISVKGPNDLDGENYLVPADAPNADRATATTFETASVPLLSIMQQFRRSGARISVLILDACRDSPFEGEKKPQTLPPSSEDRRSNDFYLLYSAGAGETALDRLAGADNDPNSVFTRVLLRNLSDTVRLEDLARSIQSGVSALTAGKQNPSAYSGTDARLTITGGVTAEDRPLAIKAPAGSAPSAAKAPILREVQESVDRARTAEADAREWAHSAGMSELKARLAALQADEARARSQKHLAGYGMRTLDDGAVYEGQLANGDPNGVGVAVKDGVYVYRGEWAGQQRSGFGAYQNLRQHYTYAGEWRDNKEDGAGVYRLANNEVYDGEFHHGVPDGFGVLTGDTSDPFREEVGQFNDSERGASYSVVYERKDVVVYGMTKHGRLEGPAAKLDRAGRVLEQGTYEDDVLKMAM